MQKIQQWFRFFQFQNCIILFLSLFCVFFIVRSEPNVTIHCDWVIAAGGRRSLGAPAPPLWLGSIVLMMVVAQQRQHIVSSAVRRATWDRSYYIGRRRSGQKQRKLCVAHRPTGATISQTHFFPLFHIRVSVELCSSFSRAVPLPAESSLLYLVIWLSVYSL
jgi:hypothetical protein